MNFFKLTLFSLLIGFGSFGQSRILGKVSSKNTGLDLEKVKILVLPDNQESFSNRTGNFEINLPKSGRKTIVFSLENFKSLVFEEVVLQNGKDLILNAELDLLSSDLEEVTITAEKSAKLANVQKITIEQVLRFPATFFDPARLASNYAGVSGTNDQANGMSVHGNSPDANNWKLEGVDIVNPNHLTNAGTVSDRPTLTSGGQNILSAQMLGETEFYKGLLPTDMSNATASTIDMSLRPGNLQKTEYTLQAGLIGIDAAAEGPIVKGKSSFLVNYRYSFTGILAQMGVKFGGESIQFQDGGATLFYQTKKAGSFKLFGIWGLSTNDYESPNKADPAIRKELFDINFKNVMMATGLTHKVHVNAKTQWQSTLAFSKIDASRMANGQNAATLNETDVLANQMLSFKTLITKEMSKSIVAKFGLNFVENPQLFTSGTKYAQKYESSKIYEQNFGYVQPFAAINLQTKNGFEVEIGTGVFASTDQNFTQIEPRLLVQKHLSKNLKVFGQIGQQSQNQKIAFPMAANSAISTESEALGIEYVLGKVFVQVQAFRQLSRNVPYTLGMNGQMVSYWNENENYSLPVGQPALSKAKVTGLDLSLQRYLNKGWFFMAAGSVYDSRYRSDNQWLEGRFSGKFTSNFVLGKEWNLGQKRILGVNGRVVYNGGYREPEIDLEASKAQFYTVYKNYQYTVALPNYFRSDLKLYVMKNRKAHSTVFSIDIQNLSSMQNRTFAYFDPVLDKVVMPVQQGMVPLMSYRVNL